MKDEEFERRIQEVLKIIKELERGEISIEKGEEIMRKGLDLLNELRRMLDNIGSGRVYLLDESRELNLG